MPFSPFNVMGFPLVLGTGVDAFFLLLHRRAAGGRDWVETAMPSIVASQLSTATCFLIGVAIPVPHVRFFFVYMFACTLVSLALQVTWVPALVVVGTRVRAADPDKRARPARRGAACLAGLAVACLWAVLLQYRQPVGRAFDMRKQLRDDTPTHQFLVRADAMTPTPTSFVYAYTRGLEHDWPALDEAALGTGCVREPRSLSWHALLPPGAGVREWLADARASFAYRAFVDAEANVSVALYMAAHDMGVDADRSHAELACLARAAEKTPTCYASYERMGGYTVVELCRELVFLAAMSCVVATAFAVGVARGRGLLALVALALSYGGGVAVIGAMRPAHRHAPDRGHADRARFAGRLLHAPGRAPGRGVRGRGVRGHVNRERAPVPGHGRGEHPALCARVLPLPRAGHAAQLRPGRGGRPDRLPRGGHRRDGGAGRGGVKKRADQTRDGFVAVRAPRWQSAHHPGHRRRARRPIDG